MIRHALVKSQGEFLNERNRVLSKLIHLVSEFQGSQQAVGRYVVPAHLGLRIGRSEPQ